MVEKYFKSLIITKKNNLYILDFKDKEKIIENIRGINGIFYQLNLKNLGDLNKYITKKCQTMTYFGFNKNQLSPYAHFLYLCKIH